jgi:hypothetical protein
VLNTPLSREGVLIFAPSFCGCLGAGFALGSFDTAFSPEPEKVGRTPAVKLTSFQGVSFLVFTFNLQLSTVNLPGRWKPSLLYFLFRISTFYVGGLAQKN